MKRYVLTGPDGQRKDFWRRKHPLVAVGHPIPQEMPDGCAGVSLPGECRVALGETCVHGFTLREIKPREVSDA